MGIHDRVNPYSLVIHVGEVDRSQLPNGDFTSDDASSIASVHVLPRRGPRRGKNSRAEALDYQSLSERLHCKSKRYARRLNHLNMVKTLVGLEESEIEGEFAQISDNYGNSIFSSLFMEAEKMQVWNSYIELSEEEQRLVIEGDDTVETSDDDSINSFIMIDLADEDVDKRVVHPSFSSKECFNHIDQNIRNFLKRRHVPLGLSESIELEMRKCFKDNPYAMFEMNMDTSFGRLMVHAVAQYLHLESFSFDCGSSKTVSVVNKTKEFTPPTQFLYQYLEWKSGRHQL